MKKIIIGITPRYDNFDSAGQNQDYTNVKISLNYFYLHQLNQRSVPAIILPLASPCIEEVLELCSGFIISGGSDIDPSFYNEVDSGLSRKINPILDTIDRQVVLHAQETKKPLLGICRGVQALAVFLGGSLHQDIQAANLIHEVTDNCHTVTNAQETELTKLLDNEFKVNHFHHQAINRIPQDFVITYMHQNTIEGISHVKHPWLGFQWHPERLETKETKVIFDYFVKKVNEYGKNN